MRCFNFQQFEALFWHCLKMSTTILVNEPAGTARVRYTLIKF